MTSDNNGINEPSVDELRAIKDENAPYTYTTFDGRRCTYTIPLLESLVPSLQLGTKLEKYAFFVYCIKHELDPGRVQAHFVKYPPKEGRKPKPAAFVTAWEVFIARAQQHPQFDGFECGIVWQVANGERMRGNACDYPVKQMVGGWARVHRKDQSVARYVEVPLEEMKSMNKSWQDMPATMAMKTPSSRALRQAFPECLGGQYTEEESVAFHDGRQLKAGDTLPATDLDELADELNEPNEPTDEPINEPNSPEVTTEVPEESSIFRENTNKDIGGGDNVQSSRSK